MTALGVSLSRQVSHFSPKLDTPTFFLQKIYKHSQCRNYYKAHRVKQMTLSFLGVILKVCSGMCFYLRAKGWCENVSKSPPLSVYIFKKHRYG